MKAVVRLALMYVRFMPLQIWVAGLGAAMMVSACAFNVPGAAAVMGVGAMLLIAVPALLGGPSMRAASAGCGLHLRPHGHRKMLGGAMFAVVLLTVIMVITQWIPYNLGRVAPEGAAHGFLTTAGTLRFAVGVWSAVSLVWLLLFAAIGSQQLGFGVFAALILGSNILGPWLDRISPPFAILPGAAVAAWVLFAAWYLRSPRIRGVLQVAMDSTYGTGQKQNTVQRAMRSLLDNRAEGRDAAMRACLFGSPSLKSQAAAGVISLITLLPMVILQARSHRAPGPWNPLILLYGLYALTGGGLAFNATRRARLLWLRAGLDRSALFDATEHCSLIATAVGMLSVVIPFAVIGVWMQPALALVSLAFLLTMSTFGFVVMYVGMALGCRSSKALDFALVLGFSALLIVLMVVLRPRADASVPLAAAATVGCLMLALVMRAFAHSRWQHLDWHVARPPALPQRLR